MKSFITSAVIAVLLVTGGILFNICINNLSEQLMEISEEITAYINEDDFKTASEKVTELSEFVDKKKIILASVINHESIDDIELCLSELQSYSDNQVRIESLVRCKKLKHLFYHLPSNYSISPQNIL